YGDKKLKQETIDQLDDPLYQNIILPTELERALKNKEDMTVYFFSTTCIHCINESPVVVPLVEELDIDMKKLKRLEYEIRFNKFNKETSLIEHLIEELENNNKKLNTIENEEALNEFNIQRTPTIIHYENGEEVTRFEGAAEEEQYREFFEKNVLEQ